jgi:hypothetical protein
MNDIFLVPRLQITIIKRMDLRDSVHAPTLIFVLALCHLSVQSTPGLPIPTTGAIEIWNGKTFQPHTIENWR